MTLKQLTGNVWQKTALSILLAFATLRLAGQLDSLTHVPVLNALIAVCLVGVTIIWHVTYLKATLAASQEWGARFLLALSTLLLWSATFSALSFLVSLLIQ